MEQNTFALLTTLVLAAIATLFTILAVALPGWPLGRLLNCGIACPSNYIAAGVLLIIAIVLLTVAIAFTVMFWRGLISNSSDKIKGIVLALFVICNIFIVTAYSRVINPEVYSYHLAAAAGSLTFVSSILFTYWLGRTSVTFAQ
jgi:putative Mn2+ efflux pump MntP